MQLNYFQKLNFVLASKRFFKHLKLPINDNIDQAYAQKEINAQVKQIVQRNISSCESYLLGIIDNKSIKKSFKVNLTPLTSTYHGLLVISLSIKSLEHKHTMTREKIIQISKLTFLCLATLPLFLNSMPVWAITLLLFRADLLLLSMLSFRLVWPWDDLTFRFFEKFCWVEYSLLWWGFWVDAMVLIESRLDFRSSS